ncbi:hypothetical protein [Neisseria zoodegmatis]|uniref:Uncharacterized protein n=1 Tax=Neisseria zoodegmatis TaxID=326523 RepID=A0ABX3WEY6_9NEIS|nr:hypothetical protein [Neisseria zoodegmatis]OSI09708.1 hypothetical protein BWD10_07945 [Neisseria zoodegmatis]
MNAILQLCLQENSFVTLPFFRFMFHYEQNNTQSNRFMITRFNTAETIQRKRDKKNAHNLAIVCQVYKGEIEEKLSADYSNQPTGRIMPKPSCRVNIFMYIIYLSGY